MADLSCLLITIIVAIVSLMAGWLLGWLTTHKYYLRAKTDSETMEQQHSQEIREARQENRQGFSRLQDLILEHKDKGIPAEKTVEEIRKMVKREMSVLAGVGTLPPITVKIEKKPQKP